MMTQEGRLQRFVDVIQRANRIAQTTELDALLDKMLDLLIDVTNAEAGTLYLYDGATHELIFKVVKGGGASERLRGVRISADRGVAGHVLREARPVFVNDVAEDPHWDRKTGELADMQLQTMYCIPLLLRGKPVGVVQVFNISPDIFDDPDELALIELLHTRLVTEVEKRGCLQRPNGASGASRRWWRSFPA
jgi:GAF domain-containing protein